MSVRAAQVNYAPGMIGLIGGHLELGDADLESVARRELTEETGLELAGVPLTYLESEVIDAAGEAQVTVTFLAPAPPGAEPAVRAPDELAEVGWWSLATVEADPRCPAWLPDLLRRAASLDLEETLVQKST